MQLPPALLSSLRNIPGFDDQAFIDVHRPESQLTSIRLNPGKTEKVADSFHERGIELEEVRWASGAYYLSSRPSFTFDPLFHAGCYYVQEASSMFVEYALRQSVDLAKPLKVLDLCAAPGGKSTHLQSLISPDSLLVSNEVIRQRVNILKDNIVKWGAGNVVVTNNDPRDFGKLKGYFDVIVVDAPCSGSGLFRKDADAVNEWSENNVMLCSQRQQRILADVMPALKEDGVLIYSTCSYSSEEDEEIIDWLADNFSLSGIQINTPAGWNITEAVSPQYNHGYRFWPHLAKGEGFFLAIFRNNEGPVYKNKNRPVIKPVTRQLKPVVQKWANVEGYELIKVNNKIYCWPAVLLNDFDGLLQHLRIIYSGTLLGELIHQKLIPDHALAMSRLRHADLETVALEYDDAITYLKKQNFEATIAKPGWQLVTYETQCLGWINALHSRINNYYPKEMRILKQTAGS